MSSRNAPNCKLYDLSKIPPAKARVMAAKDALARLRYRKVESGHYVGGYESIVSLIDLDNKDASDISNDNLYFTEIDARKYVTQLEQKCPSCALGNLFLSHIRLFDKVLLENDTYGRDNITDSLENYFDANQLNLIECAFEGDDITGDFNNDDEEYRAALSYYSKYSDTKKRLRAILINIIKNNGTFKPTDYRTKEQKECDARWNSYTY